MWKDPIVEETRSRREEPAQRFNYDIKGHRGSDKAAVGGERAKADHSLTEECCVSLKCCAAATWILTALARAW